MLRLVETSLFLEPVLEYFFFVFCAKRVRPKYRSNEIFAIWNAFVVFPLEIFRRNRAYSKTRHVKYRKIAEAALERKTRRIEIVPRGKDAKEERLAGTRRLQTGNKRRANREPEKEHTLLSSWISHGFVEIV